MESTMTRGAFFLACALAVGAAGCAEDEAETGSARMAVADPTTPYLGKTMGEWGAEWWRWAYEIPASVNPINDETGDDCGQHQTRDAYFLAGNFGGTSERTCTLPRGKPIFFPIVNVAADNCGVPEEERSTDEENRIYTQDQMSAVGSATLVVDGETIGTDPASLARFRTQPVEFSYEVPANDSLYDSWESDFEGTCTPSYTSGYWVMLDPPAPGAHELHFSATMGEGADAFSLDVTYHLTVE